MRDIQEWGVVEEWYGKRQLAAPAAPFDIRGWLSTANKSDHLVLALSARWRRENSEGSRGDEDMRGHSLSAESEGYSV
jgi:hypothetical protein